MLVNAGYQILMMEFYEETKTNAYAFGYSPEKKEWVTWGVTKYGGNYSFFWGHYFTDPNRALKDYHERLAKEYGRMEEQK